MSDETREPTAAKGQDTPDELPAPKVKVITRRELLKAGATTAAVFTIVPRHVLGGPGYAAPSNTITRAVIGTGGQGTGGHVTVNQEGAPPVTLAVCDVDKNHLNGALQKAGRSCQGFSDWRRVLDMKGIDAIHIATPPHWHAIQSIAAAQTGRDVLCEKPMTKFIREAPAVAEAIERYGRVFQFNTHQRFSDSSRKLRKLVASGLLGTPLTVRVSRQNGYNWKVAEWSGRKNLAPQPVPDMLDYDMWLGPAPFKPYHPHRVHGSFRGYWDYDGGGLNDMGQHYLDPVQYFLGKDDTSPVEIEAHAPEPAHHDAVGMWGWVKMTYADGTVLIIESGEWGEPGPGAGPFLEGPKGKVFGGSEGINLDKTEPAGLLDQLSKYPDPPRMIDFNEAIKTRVQPGGNARVGLRSVSLMHLANTAIRTGRKLRYDPVALRFIGDEEANRLQDVPLRAPWHL